jgi:hypothetical protein
MDDTTAPAGKVFLDSPVRSFTKYSSPVALERKRIHFSGDFFANCGGMATLAGLRRTNFHSTCADESVSASDDCEMSNKRRSLFIE